MIEYITTEGQDEETITAWLEKNYPEEEGEDYPYSEMEWQELDDFINENKLTAYLVCSDSCDGYWFYHYQDGVRLLELNT